MNKIWDKLIENYELNGIESNVDLPAFGLPTIPTSANNFKDSHRYFSSISLICSLLISLNSLNFSSIPSIISIG